MAGSRKWSVESKEFEMLIKGGKTGVRIFERSKGKQRSIFLKRDELKWLAGTVKEVVKEETSKVFWDQSRAEYPRVIAQRRLNRHGRFLTIEEFEGSKRCGNILIPEGRSGQGWIRSILELGLAKETLYEGREGKELMKAGVERGSKSYVEALGVSLLPEPNVSEMGSQAQSMGGKEKGKMVVPLVSVVPAKHTGVQGMGSKFLISSISGEVGDSGSAEMGPQALPASLGPANHSGVQGMALKQMLRQTQGAGKADSRNSKKGETPACRDQAPVKRCEAMKSTKIIGDGLLTGLEGAGNFSEQEMFNARQELGVCRETLIKLKREIDLGLSRLDRALQKTEGLGPGQEGSGVRLINVGPKNNWVKPNKKQAFKPKKTAGVRDGLLGVRPSSLGPQKYVGWKVLRGTGESSSAGPSVHVSSGEKGTDDSGQTGEGDCAGGDGSDEGAKELCRSKEMDGDCAGGDGSDEGAKELCHSSSAARASDPVSSGEQGTVAKLPVNSTELDGFDSGDLGPVVLLPARLSDMGGANSGGCSDTGEGVSLLPSSVGGPEAEVSAVATQIESFGVLVPSVNRKDQRSGPAITPKQAQVFQRKETRSSKPTKSWVAERCAWHNGTGVDLTSTGLGKNSIVSLNMDEETEGAGAGLLEVLDDQVGENTNEEDLKFVWDVKGNAGLSWDGQDGKLKKVLGQIMADNNGLGASTSAGVDADSLLRLRDDNTSYEA
jgi:hypothetical protein